jgi:sulfite exporter TauE/SafE
MIFLTAFLTGLFGSFHCAGMCGPIALSLPVHHLNFQGRTIGILLYNVGRALTYSILGGFLGALGMGVIIAGYQQALSISLGIVLLFSATFPFWKNNGFFNVSFPRISHWLKARFSYLLKKKSFAALFAIGIINGLLPCGLVYLALAGAIASGDILLGALFMAVFGLGTLPAMFGVTLFSSLSMAFRKRLQNLAPVLAGLMACLLILLPL